MRTFGYDVGTSELLTVNDANGYQSSVILDGLSRPAAVFEPSAADGEDQVLVSSYTYTEPVYDPVQLTFELGRIRHEPLLAAPEVTFFDGFGRVVGVKTEYEVGGVPTVVVAKLQKFNGKGQLEKEALLSEAANPDLNVLDATFDGLVAAGSGFSYSQWDAMGRLISRQLPDSTSMQYLVDVPGVKVTVDQNLNAGSQGVALTEIFDAQGRPIRSFTCSDIPTYPYDSCAGGAATTVSASEQTYDVLDRTISKKVCNVPSFEGADCFVMSTTEYDGLGNVVSVSDANLGSAGYGENTFVYDKRGDLAKSQDATGRLIKQKVDRAGRVKTIKARKHKTKVKFVAAGDNGAGNVQSVRVIDGETHDWLLREFEYDARGNPVYEQRRVRMGEGNSPRIANKQRIAYDDAEQDHNNRIPCRRSHIRDHLFRNRPEPVQHLRSEHRCRQPISYRQLRKQRYLRFVRQHCRDRIRQRGPRLS